MKRIIVCGSREYDDWGTLQHFLDQALAAYGEVTIIEGGARGADFLARAWAKYRGQGHEAYPANWTKLGRAAGPERNQRMVDQADADLVIAFPGDTGTEDCKTKARAKGIEVFEVPA